MIRTMLAASAAMTLGSMSGPAEALSEYRWKNRPLLVFAPSDQSAALAEQRRLVAASRKGYADRDMVVVYVVGDNVTADLGASPSLSAVALRKRYGVQSGAFRAILVGKDGGAKLSQSRPIATGSLFNTIDAMPMRRDEMRGR